MADSLTSRWSVTSPRPRRCSRPAEWKRPDSSARRSQSSVGATRASSRLTSSESDMFEREEAALVAGAEEPITAEPTRADHAMAGDKNAEAVLRAECSGGPRRSRAPGESRELAVRDDVTARHVAQGLCERLSVGRQIAKIERDIGEVFVCP